jgi:hypothetical protein
MFSLFSRYSKAFLRLGLIPALLLLSTFGNASGLPAKGAPFVFMVRLTEQAAQGIAELGLQVPVNGRLYVIVSQDDDSEPREQIDVTGAPFWGKNVFGFSTQKPILLKDRDPEVIGYPLAQLAELPAGEYSVQAFLTVYTTFHRADGFTVYMHQDAGDGQWQWESPGNAYSQVQRLYIDPNRGGRFTLDLTEVIQPDEPLQPGEVLQQGNPRDTDWVKYIKIQSQALSEFWGQPMYIGANILLPKGYNENPDQYYPVIYQQGHFPGGSAPLGFRVGNSFYNFWNSDSAPRFIAVTIRDANPYYDTSYSVDSANVGPYGQAIMNELIPYIEEHFRIIREPWARVVAGGSTGGWEALAMKVFHPDFFGGTWAWCPDAVDFHYHQLVNVYEDENAYYTFYDWIKVERPSARNPDGNLRFTIKQENYWELAMGTNDRSGGQWDIWEAVYSPLGPDGYPLPVWDPLSGAIDHSVAEYWKQHYDLNHYIQQNWATLAPLLDGQLTVTNGMMDTYYLNEATYLLWEFVKSANPPANIQFDFGFRKPHCWRGASPSNPDQNLSMAEFVQIAGDWVAAHRP